MRLIVGAVLIALVPPAAANGVAAPNLCQSEKFRTAFADGLDSIDQPTVSHDLIALGDAVIPCLEAVAREGGRSLGLTKCETNDSVCRTWAVRALAGIKTGTAEKALVRMLNEGWSGQQLYAVLSAIVIRHPAMARAALLKTLGSPDSRARSWATLALGAVGQRDDFDAMVRCARGLPTTELARVARAFEFLGDPRAVPVLRELASTLPENSRGDVNGSITRLENGEPLRPE